jgi:hypothetical protein
MGGHIPAPLSHPVDLGFFYIVPGVEEDFSEDIAREDRSLASDPR